MPKYIIVYRVRREGELPDLDVKYAGEYELAKKMVDQLMERTRYGTVDRIEVEVIK